MKIAIVLSRVPYPLEKGDKLRAFNQIKELSKHHDIYLFALHDGKVHPKAKQVLGQYCKQTYFYSLSFWSRCFYVFSFFVRGLPLQCGYFYNARIKRKINAKIDKIAPERIYAQLIRTAEYVRDRKEVKTIDYQDVFSKGMHRMMERVGFLKKIFYRVEYKRLLKYEAVVFDSFDYKTIITKVDRDLIPHVQSSKIVVVPNGVDFELFNPVDCPKKYDLIFTGNMSYMPNVFACEYIVKEILPELVKKYPAIKIVLCGVQPSLRVLTLKGKNVEVTGWVEDIRSYYAQSKVFIAPMQLGTGLQNKLLEAMSMRLPCITSPLANAPLVDHADNCMMVRNSVLGYVEAIDALLTNQSLYDSIADAGRRFVKENYNWQQTTQILETVLLKEKVE